MRHVLTVACGLCLAMAGCSAPTGGAAHDHTAASHEVHASAEAGGSLAVPAAIRHEHEHLHHALASAMAAGGETGDRAKDVADVLNPHFELEEQYAMPPLGLLPLLARDRMPSDADARSAIDMAERLRSHYDQMLREHQQITDALKKLAQAAEREKKPEAKAFAETLLAHASNEEQVLYPTTLLIGNYLKLRMNGAAHP